MSQILIEGFSTHGSGQSIAYRREPVKWALGCSSETLPLGVLGQQVQREATLAVALGVDDQFDLVLVDENDGLNPIAEIERAISALAAVRDQLEAMTGRADA